MSTDPSRTFELSEHWAGIEKTFGEKAKSLKKSMNHSATGIAVEGRFQKMLAEFLPRRYVLAPGFVVNAEGARSPMIDLLVSDCLYIPPLSVESSYSVFTCESVAAGIEITTGPRGRVGTGAKAVSKLHADLRKLSAVRSLGENRQYQTQVPIVESGGITFKTASIVAVSPGPRSFLVTCGDEWASAATYERQLVAALRAVQAEGKSVWLHAAYSVKHGLLTFKPYSDFEGTWITKDPLLEFVLFLNQTLTDFHTYQINLRRYRPSIPQDGAIVGSPPTFMPGP